MNSQWFAGSGPGDTLHAFMVFKCKGRDGAGSFVPQISKSAVSQVSKPAGCTASRRIQHLDALPIWKSAMQQVGKPAVRLAQAAYKVQFPGAWLFPSWIFPFLLRVVLGGWIAGWAVRAPAQVPSPDGRLADSYSGQFIVTGSSVKSALLTLPQVTTNTDYLRLDPAVLAVSAERIKLSLYRLLALPTGRDWRGQICLVLHPAVWTDESVTVVVQPLGQSWNYVVQLPDVVQRARFLRGLTSVLLLEWANRQATGDSHSAEIPAWLIDGLSLKMVQDQLSDVVLSSPDQPMDDPQARRPLLREHGLDPLAEVRWVLRRQPALTFDQLSWPTADQLAGADGGAYYASAQLFVTELLNLPDGPARLQRMLAGLPACYNWQTAFLNAFHDQFPRSLDLEKWWALTLVGFLSHSTGAPWTPADSAGRLNELLTVPVEVRMASNTLPGHVEIPLQSAITTLAPGQQTTVLETRLRDLEIARVRMAPRFDLLTADYCRVLADYLGERPGPAPRQTSAKHPPTPPVRLNPRETITRLDALDTRRRTLEAAVPAATGAAS
jgi:hypothetical protein